MKPEVYTGEIWGFIVHVTSFFPAEKQTCDYPGCEAEIEFWVEDMETGQDVTDELPAETLEWLEQEAMERVMEPWAGYEEWDD